MSDTPAPSPTIEVIARSQRTALARFGPWVVGLGVLCALATFLVFAGLTPLAPTSAVVTVLFAADAAVIALLLGLVAWESARLIVARRAGTAAARLHIRIVALFSIVAAAPAIFMAVVASLTIDRGLNPAFMQDLRGFVQNTSEAARLYRESQCRALLREGELTASDIDRGRVIYDADRGVFRDYFGSRARFLGFTTAAIIRRDGTVVEEGTPGAAQQIVKPEPSDFNDARNREQLCLVLSEGRAFVALLPLSAFEDNFLYISRPIDPFAVEFPRQASAMTALYDAFDQHRGNILFAFALMFVLMALIMLLSAVWLGLSFANTLVGPIRRLIRATDQVASGNLFVEVPVRRSEGDLAHLGATFNKMTNELRQQQSRLIAASNLIDERRIFTEAVLAGVPAGVIGVSGEGNITVLNASARKHLGDALERAQGRPLGELLPEIESVLADARQSRSRQYQGQITLARGGRERIFNVRVTSDPQTRAEKGMVITLDDITDLVSAQRTSAWADVARRIAHEIKNPLTPIQLSAERIRRKYGKVIVEDREIFEQCTATIIRQVDDIKRMVDEFSSFARMPKPRLEDEDVCELVRQVIFLMRVGHPDVAFEENLPGAPLFARIDRRLLSQALTNIVKNATEGIAASQKGVAGRVRVTLSVRDGTAAIDVIDNGKGFPVENRGRLLEPYMTTRAEGTGLGLAIVAKILEDHGGGIELLDAPAEADGPPPPEGETPGAWVRLAFRIDTTADNDRQPGGHAAAERAHPTP